MESDPQATPLRQETGSNETASTILYACDSCTLVHRRCDEQYNGYRGLEVDCQCQYGCVDGCHNESQIMHHISGTSCESFKTKQQLPFARPNSTTNDKTASSVGSHWPDCESCVSEPYSSLGFPKADMLCCAGSAFTETAWASSAPSEPTETLVVVSPAESWKSHLETYANLQQKHSLSANTNSTSAPQSHIYTYSVAQIDYQEAIDATNKLLSLSRRPSGPITRTGDICGVNLPRLGWRYPILTPLIPFLKDIISADMSRHLLELYFSPQLADKIQAEFPFLMVRLFRKKACLQYRNPRSTKPALLASMLLLAAQTYDDTNHAGSPIAWEALCNGLLRVVLQLMQPFRNARHYQDLNYSHSPSPPSSVSASLDDVLTYIHLAIAFYTKDDKTCSMHWWSAAWSLAYELRLFTDLKPQVTEVALLLDLYNYQTIDEHDCLRNMTEIITAEEREERRRAFWLLFLANSYFLICYKRQLFLKDSECQDICPPLPEEDWQSGQFSNLRDDKG